MIGLKRHVRHNEILDSGEYIVRVRESSRQHSWLIAGPWYAPIVGERDDATVFVGADLRKMIASPLWVSMGKIFKVYELDD